MKINVTNLSEDLQKATLALLPQLGFCADEDGVVLQAAPSDRLTVERTNGTVTIGYAAKNQYFRGLRLLKQHGEAPTFAVTEKCAASELGIMLDCSRNAVRTVAHVKEIIRTLALMGYDQLQLYTEDTYEVDGEPYFGYLRGRYSKAELQEIDAYATQFGIEVVPCIQTLAHLNQIFRWRPYSPIRDVSDILLIDDDRTYALIDRMFATLSQCFGTRKIHIGMDEAHLVGRGKYEDQHGAVQNRSALIMKHLTRVIEIAQRYGYQPMIWCDMFFRLAFHGQYYVEDGELDSTVTEMIPKNIRLVYWDYTSCDKKIYDNMLRNLSKFGREMMFAGGAWMWSGFAPSNAFSMEVADVAMDACVQHGVDKILMTMWGDNGAECSALSVLPTLVKVAEKQYGHAEYEQAFLALTGIPVKDFLQIEAVDVVGAQLDPRPKNPSKYMLYNDCLCGLFDPIVGEGDGEIYAKHSKALKATEKVAGRYAYLFRTQRLLAEVLLLKYELGVKTRTAYRAGNRDALAGLVQSQYKPLVRKLNAFYHAFKEQWYKENKPFGFEVQDYRLGGLIKRVEHCIETITDFVGGKIAAIPELEQALLDFHGRSKEEFNKGATSYNYFAGNIGANVF